MLNSRIPAHLTHNVLCLRPFIPVLGEGMGGSLFWQDLISLAHSVGFSTPCLVSASQIAIYNCELKAKAGNNKATLTFNDMWWSFHSTIEPALYFAGDISYASGTYRLFKLPKGSVLSEATVTYRGTVAEFPDQLDFDSSHCFKVQ